MEAEIIKKNRKFTQNKLIKYPKKILQQNADESRRLLKMHFDYLIFMYEADKVGITATGEDDQNELYPNDNAPDIIEKTCLELYRESLADLGDSNYYGEGRV